jgi:solute carrier family 25 iron transporter 28/37
MDLNVMVSIESFNFLELEHFPPTAFVIAGATAGLVEHSCMFPVDLVKTRLQSLKQPGQPKYATIRQAFGSILKTEGFFGMYRGLTAVLISALPSHALYFTTYEKVKQRLTPTNSNANRPSTLTAGTAGVCATIAHDLFVTPLDVVKQRMQVYNSPYKTISSGIKSVYSHLGMRGFYAAFPLTLTMNIPYTAVHFIVYENLKHLLHAENEKEKPWKHLICGAGAGMIGGLVSNPFDVVKTRVQTQEFENFHTVKQVARQIYSENGWKSFMTGVSARMLYFAPSAAITWVTYEQLKRLFADHEH